MWRDLVWSVVIALVLLTGFWLMQKVPPKNFYDATYKRTERSSP